jgi:hypothetical protein
MMLAGIEPGAAHSDLRTFQCPKCNHVHKMLVEATRCIRLTLAGKTPDLGRPRKNTARRTKGPIRNCLA